MTNKEIARSFKKLADLMELHGENSYRIRSYSNAYITFRKLGQPLTEMSDEDIKSLKGVGDAIASKTRSLLTTGTFDTMERYLEKTPPGVQEMIQIKGFGPKKIKTIWKDMGVETIGELLYACNENRLVELKGFGAKTQEDLKKTLEYYLRSRDKFHYATLEEEADDLVEELKTRLPNCQIQLTGEMRRKCNVINEMEVLIAGDYDPKEIFDGEFLTEKNKIDNGVEAFTVNEIPVFIRNCKKEEFGSKLFRYTATEEFMNSFLEQFKGTDFRNLETEQAVFEKVKLPPIEPELRETTYFLAKATENNLLKLIEEKDLKGVVHNHTTYSDGLHTLEEMANAAKDLGYEYIVISDHSKSAFYANGLKEERLHEQWAEIDSLNAKMENFKIFKGIESDILSDGKLDYPEELLKQFDCIIASVHSNLKMDIDKATTRLVRAIENPYTHILGHPTGRLLLSRKGYPIDYQRIIDACAANGVAIELNANPHRLDLDWRWIPVAMEKGVKISINPDAHSVGGLQHTRFGVFSARKGGLTKEMCLNALGMEAFLKAISK